MKKSLSKIFMAAVTIMVLGTVCLGLAGCIPVKNVRLDELRSREGVMLMISSTVEGPIDWYDDDRITGSTYNINWDGSIERVTHRLESGESAEKKMLDSEDYMKFYKFAESAYLNDTYKNYSETDVCDGSTYCFRYFPDGKDKGVILYAGYCYSNKKLYGMVELAISYFYQTNRNEPGATIKVMGWEDYMESTEVMLSIRFDDFYLHKSIFDKEGTLIVYSIGWDGTISKTTLYQNGTSEDNGSAKLSDDDFAVLYSFAHDNFTVNSFEKYHEDRSDDGYSWSFYLFPYASEDIKLYYGPINGNEELKYIAGIAESYFPSGE